MSPLRWLIALFFIVPTAGCDTTGVDHCADREVFVTFSSDIVGQDDETRCFAAPADCGDEVTCACLGATMESGPPNWSFCLSAGSCTETEAGVEVTCPGG